MASLVSHGLVALTFGKIAFHNDAPPRLWTIAVVSSILPDLDVVGFGFGIRYGDLLGHRGFTHSLLFALIWSLLIVRFASAKAERPWKLRLFFFLVTASHGFLDAMTDGGLGVAFFSPFDTTRYFFPWRPVHVSPIGLVPFLSTRGLEVLLSEVVWIWGPAFLCIVAVQIVHSARRQERKKS